MRKFKRLTMTLALLIMAVTGAWAQTAFGVKEITADMLPASWSTDNSAVTADDLAKLGFMEVTKDAANTWTGAPQEGVVRLIYTLCESVNWVNGEGGYVSSYSSRKGFYSCLDGQKIFITTELTEWSLTPDADKKVWTLDKMPANDVELQVEYFAESNLYLSKDALKDKGSIAVTAGDLGVQFGEDGKSANTITEGTAMTVTYNGTKKVIGVKAEKKAAPAGTPLDNTTTAWTAGTYAVPAGGLTYSAAITVSGDVTLVLTDGETLTLNKGISLASGATLTIEGNGTMNVNGTNGADINTQKMNASADSGTEAISGSGTVVLTSGTLTAKGGKGGNVNDYYPECKGGHGAAGISCTLIVNGGTVTATGGNGGSLTNGGDPGPMGVAGNGGAGISGALTVNGGTLTATGGDGGAKSTGEEAQAGTNGRGISSTWTAGTGITFSDSANGTTWTANSGTSSTQKYVKAE